MKIYQHHNLKPYNTFGIDVLADEFIVLEAEEDIMEFVYRLGDRPVAQTPPTTLILGGGSNILFTGEFHGTVVKLDTRGIELLEEGDEVLVKIAAGEEWDSMVDYCVKRGWGGLENLSGIPGNAGSSPIQNIGAYGSELKDVFHSLEAIEISNGKKLIFNQGECQFSYRDSIFKRALKGRIIITDVLLRLNKKTRPNISYQALAQKFSGVPEREITIRDVRDAVLQIRASRLPDPRLIGNAGSFFKNPVVDEKKLKELKDRFPGIVHYMNHPSNSEPAIENFKLAAGWLIEQCGWKGYREGDAGVHKDQALVLVNYGNASGKQIFHLSERVRESVKEKFGVDLEREVNIY